MVLPLFACHLYLGAEVLPGNMTPDGAGVINTASCTGSESRLIDCPRLTTVPPTCTHSNDVGVFCPGTCDFSSLHSIRQKK